MVSHHDTLLALSRLKNGETELSSEQYLELLEAVEQTVQALQLAPTGADPVATGLWYNHERTPALARLAAALSPEERGDSSQELADQQLSDREVLMELHAALLKSSR